MQNYQLLKSDNENTHRSICKLNQEKEECIENVKRQYERQKQKELEAIREYVHKDKDSVNLSTYTSEVNGLVSALKNKDREISEIQTNMADWKKETLAKLADKFEVELNKELDKRMKEYKEESFGQQEQISKLRKEMDNLVKEHRQSSVSLGLNILILL